jgi:AmmeMemoRadiSam system protein B
MLRRRGHALPPRAPVTERERPRLRAVEAFPATVEGQPVVCLRDPSGVTDAVLTVPRPLVPLLALLDGTRSLLDVQAEIMRRHGELVLRSQLEAIVETLDQHLFLEGPRLEAERARQRDAFLAAPMRAAAHAGRAYPAEPEALCATLDACFAPPDGPGAIAGDPDTPVQALIAPHIDFGRGGPVYAWGYGALTGATLPDCVVILGTAHAGLDGHPLALTRKAYDTPFGPLAVDEELLDAILRRMPGEPLAAEPAHRAEHSIEFQAVWLQYVRRRSGSDREVRILPVLASFVHECLVQGREPGSERGIRGALDALREAMAAVPRRYWLIAGADLAHVGPRFGDPWPVDASVLVRLAADDRALLDAAATGDAAAFFAETVRQGDRNRVCGLSPIYALLALLPAGQGRVLRYGQWPDPQGTVTFASLLFEAGGGGA